MRAKAGLLILLISMISLTGFSQTTDLNQNSDVITISDASIGNAVITVIA